MINSFSENNKPATDVMRLLTGLLTIALAVVFLALPMDSSEAKKKKYRKYKKSQKIHHRVHKRVRKRRRHRIKKRVRRQVVRANPVLAKARTDFKIGSKYFKALRSFYAARGYKKAWINGKKLNNNGAFLLKNLRLAHLDGLDQADYDLPVSNYEISGLRDDIKISFSLIRYAEQVQAGRLSPSKVVAEHDLKPQHPDLLALLKQIAKSKEPGLLFNNLPPPHLQYRQLKTRLASLRADIKRRFAETSSLDFSMRTAIGNVAMARENMIIANMERWRWLPRQLGEKHIWVNLPSYRLLVKQMGKIAFETKGIIGKITAPTPLISSKIKNIIVNPFWHIPASVVASEILPKLQVENNEYLQTQAIKVLRRGGRVVDPKSVDWTKITNPRTYRFRQSPGKKNALGRMKVLFPNSHSIYLHDTNEPELFSNAQRALSHGCVRLANPIGFADAIASYDDHLHSQMPGTLLGPRERWLKYKATLPVHLVYFTAEINANGNLITMPDIYGYDEKMTAMFKVGTPSS